MSAPRDGVLFDFDGTLTPRDTLLGFLAFCTLRRPLNAIAMGLWMTLATPLWLVPSMRRAYVSGAVWFATVGLRSRAIVGLVRRYGHRLRAKGDALFYPEALARLRAHAAAGREIWVVSASCRHWIRAVLPEARIIGSSFAFRWGGLTMTRRCAGGEKITRLAERIGPAPPRWHEAYGDTAADGPMLGLADRGYRVDAAWWKSVVADYETDGENRRPGPT